MRISFGGCVLDTDRRVLERGGEAVHLSPKAFAVLELLAAERPRAVSKKTLLDRIWPDVVVEEQNVKNAIVEIRAALGADEDAIRTIQRFGYAFAGAFDVEAARLVGEDRSWALAPGENVVGRDGWSSIVISATGVSRHHARITLRDGRATLEDLGSKNGTWHNDERITAPAILVDGDTLRIGVVKLTFRERSALSVTTTIG